MRGSFIFLVEINNLYPLEIVLLHFSITKIPRVVMNIMCGKMLIILIFGTNA